MISTAHKFLRTLLLGEVTPYAEELIGEYHCGFRPGRLIIDQIFTIYYLLEKHWKYNQDIHQIYKDFNQAFDAMDRNTLWLAKIEMGITKKLVSMTHVCKNNF